MPDLFSDFFLFLFAVLGYWQAYATGGVVTAVVGLFERFSKWRLTKWAYAGLFVGVAFLAAFFLAWRDEHSQRVSLAAQVTSLQQTLYIEVQKHAPDIRLAIEDVMYGPLVDEPPQDTAIVMYIAVRNAGYMPSVADRYRLILEAQGHGTVQAENVAVLDGFLLRTEAGDAVKIDKSFALYEKTLKPIPPGGMEKGVMAFIVRSMPMEQLQGSTFRLTWRDVTGKESVVTGRMNLGGSGHIPFIPGITQERLRNDSPQKR